MLAASKNSIDFYRLALYLNNMAKRSTHILDRWFEEVWNQGREEAIDEMMSPDAIANGLTDGSGQPLKGPAGFKPFFRGFRAAFPDLRVSIEDSVCEGDKITVRCHVTGVHTGDGLGFKATGRRVEFGGVCIARIQDGKIVEAWNHFDFLNFYQQLGAVPALQDPASVVMQREAHR